MKEIRTLSTENEFLPLLTNTFAAGINSFSHNKFPILRFHLQSREGYKENNLVRNEKILVLSKTSFHLNYFLLL
jgi:hypothetical protein